MKKLPHAVTLMQLEIDIAFEGRLYVVTARARSRANTLLPMP
jgi:hypothetical protein